MRVNPRSNTRQHLIFSLACCCAHNAHASTAVAAGLFIGVPSKRSVREKRKFWTNYSAGSLLTSASRAGSIPLVALGEIDF